MSVRRRHTFRRRGVIASLVRYHCDDDDTVAVEFDNFQMLRENHEN